MSDNVTVRAKFRCQTETTTRYGATASYRTFEFGAVYDDTIPEDRRFARSTPSGSLKIQVDAEGVNFVPGTSYYLDITPAD